MEKMYKKYYQTGGFIIKLNSELPFRKDTFNSKLKVFEIEPVKQEDIVINHFFNKSIDTNVNENDRIYFKKPWAVYETSESIIYEWIRSYEPYETFLRKIIANKDHTQLNIYNDSHLANVFKKGLLEDITLLPTDQFLLCRVLGFNQGCLFHSTAVKYNNKGYLFIGHSGAGKTTMAKIMKNDATILCDDRNIVRLIDNKFHLYGTWRHSDLGLVSSDSAPLKGIFFLNQSKHNRIELIKNSTQRFVRLMDHMVKSLVTKDWIESSIDIIQKISDDINCYDLQFDKSEEIKKIIFDL